MTLWGHAAGGAPTLLGIALLRLRERARPALVRCQRRLSFGVPFNTPLPAAAAVLVLRHPGPLPEAVGAMAHRRACASRCRRRGAGALAVA